MKRLSLLFLCCGALFAGTAIPLLPGQRQFELQLLLAKDHVEGSFLTPETVFADDSYVFLVSFEGQLFVLDKSQPDFPLVVSPIQVSATPLRSVRGDKTKIYITAADGNLYTYSATKPFPLLAVTPYANFGLTSLAVDSRPNGAVFVSFGQAEMAVDATQLYLSELNQGEIAVEAEKRTYAIKHDFGEAFEADSATVFDRKSGERVGSIPNPLNVFGVVNPIADLYARDGLLAQTVAGCCGAGVSLYDTRTLQLLNSINRPGSNAVLILKKENARLLVIGSEAGTVDLFDISDVDVPRPLSSLNLRELTGHTGIEDIEIRSLWADERKGLIYAGSSWGNDLSRGPTLPSFFVLEVRKTIIMSTD